MTPLTAGAKDHSAGLSHLLLRAMRNSMERSCSRITVEYILPIVCEQDRLKSALNRYAQGSDQQDAL